MAELLREGAVVNICKTRWQKCFFRKNASVRDLLVVENWVLFYEAMWRLGEEKLGELVVGFAYLLLEGERRDWVFLLSIC